MTSKVELCNRALARCGVSKPIADLNESTKEARLCRLFFDEALSQLLATRPWSFALTRGELSRLAEAPSGWEYGFGLPVDIETVIACYAHVDGREPVRWELVQLNGARVVGADVGSLWMRYVRRVEDPDLMTPLFRQALLLEVAASIAFDLTGSSSRAVELRTEAIRAMNRACSRDAMESNYTALPSGSWDTARGTSWSRSTFWP